MVPGIRVHVGVELKAGPVQDKDQTLEVAGVRKDTCGEGEHRQTNKGKLG
jgi:hypothetical protein